MALTQDQKDRIAKLTTIRNRLSDVLVPLNEFGNHDLPLSHPEYHSAALVHVSDAIDDVEAMITGIKVEAVVNS